MSGLLGDALADPATGYSVVYHVEIGLMFATLIALGPLTRFQRTNPTPGEAKARIGLADFPT